jgi:hypothetical protein
MPSKAAERPIKPPSTYGQAIRPALAAHMCRYVRVSLCRATALGVKCLAGQALVDVGSHGTESYRREMSLKI